MRRSCSGLPGAVAAVTPPAQGPFFELLPAIAGGLPHHWSPWRSLPSQCPQRSWGKGGCPHRLQPPHLAGDSQLQIQFSLVGEGRCAHGAGIVQEAEAGEAEETWRGPGAQWIPTLIHCAPWLSPLPRPWGYIFVTRYTLRNCCNATCI